MTTDTNVKNTGLTKAGAIILVLSLLASLLCIIFGIVILVDEGDSYGDDNDTYYVSTGSTYSYYVDSEEYYEFVFTPYSSGTYYIEIDDASITSLKERYGSSSASFYTSYSSYTSYDKKYETSYLYSGTSYVLRVYTGSYASQLRLYIHQ